MEPPSGDSCGQGGRGCRVGLRPLGRGSQGAGHQAGGLVRTKLARVQGADTTFPVTGPVTRQNAPAVSCRANSQHSEMADPRRTYLRHDTHFVPGTSGARGRPGEAIRQRRFVTLWGVTQEFFVADAVPAAGGNRATRRQATRGRPARG
jgi:hypothetical protein